LDSITPIGTGLANTGTKIRKKEGLNGFFEGQVTPGNSGSALAAQ
jgi:hypothetical protein